MTAKMYRRLDRLILGSLLMAVACAGCGRGPKVPTASVAGMVTINGRGVANVQVEFDPVEKIRPGYGVTDATGRYTAQFLMNQSGVPLGACVVRITHHPDGGPNVLPDRYSAKADEDPALHLTVPKEGAAFDFDVKMDRPLP